MTPNQQEYAIKVLSEHTKSNKYDGRVYIFGGFLRDRYLGIAPGDVDMLFVGTVAEALEFATDFTVKSGDFCQGVNPLTMTNSVRFAIHKDKADELWFDLTPYVPLENETFEQSAARATRYHRDFAINTLYYNLTTGELTDPANIAYQSLDTKVLSTVSTDYKYLFRTFPVRLYRMFRFQSLLGFEIPVDQLEYARKNSWNGNFVERERVSIELTKIRNGKFSAMALSNMQTAGLDPTDRGRADVFIGSGWYECEPGHEPSRIIDTPHFRWTGNSSVLHVNQGVTEVELEFDKNSYTPCQSLKCFYDNDEYFEVSLPRIHNVLRIPVKGDTLRLETDTFVPAEHINTTDTRRLGIYVSKINTYKGDEKTVNLIDHVPNLIIDHVNTGNILYHSDDTLELHNGDSREIIHTIEGYDLIFTGPPYAMYKNYGVGIDNWKPDRNFWKILYDKSRFDAKMICHVGTDFMGWWMDEIRAAGWQYNHCLCYINPDRATREYDNFPHCWEPVLAFSKNGKFPINKNTTMQKSDIYTITYSINEMYKGKDHPCQADYQTWLKISSMIDFDVLLDPFAGIGTALLCAKAKGKKAIGIEQNPQFCKQIVDNFKK